MKYIHILSNVTYGGGEQVLTTLVKDKPNQNFLYLLRKSNRIKKLDNIDNESLFKSKDNYISLIDHVKTFLYLLFIIIKIRVINHGKSSLVFHGFPCQYGLFLSRILFPKRKIYMIYHQVKNNHKGVFFFIRVIESFCVYLSNPIIGAPSFRSLISLKKYLLKLSFSKRLTFFEFKNCFSPILENEKSFSKFKNIISDKPFLLTVARFDNLKGQKRLLDFIDKNSLLNNHFNFVLVGDGENYSKCQIFKNQNKLNNVLFLGAQSRNDLFYLYSKAYGIIVPSYRESFGISIIEGLSFKKVVLVFEKSLLIHKNVKLINFKNNYTIKNISQLLKWDNKESNSLVYSSDDTMDSLNYY